LKTTQNKLSELYYYIMPGKKCHLFGGMDSANDYLRENSHSKEKVLRSSKKVSSSKKNKVRLG
jgi:hypothetical protein